MGNNEKIGIGIIGAGAMNRGTIGNLLKQSDRFEVRGLFDPAASSIEAIRRKLPNDPVVYDDYRKLVRARNIDWVMIASWNCFHKEQTIAAFKAGKDVFCQKPLATSLADATAMCRAWRTSGRQFAIGFTLRYSPHYRRIRELLDQGAIGRIVSLEFNETLEFNHGGYIMGDWRRLKANAGTHLLEKCCHDIDLVNWFVGARASRVASFGGLTIFRPENAGFMERLGRDKNGKPAYQTWGGMFALNPFTSDKDILDNQVAIIEYENGVRASFHANCQSGIPERRMYICGTEGAIRADVLTGVIEVARVGFDQKVERVDSGSHGGHGGGDDILSRELAATMIEGARPAAGLTEGLEAAVTCFGIDEACETGRVVNMASRWARVDKAMA